MHFEQVITEQEKKALSVYMKKQRRKIRIRNTFINILGISTLLALEGYLLLFGISKGYFLSFLSSIPFALIFLCWFINAEKLSRRHSACMQTESLDKLLGNPSEYTVKSDDKKISVNGIFELKWADIQTAVFMKEYVSLCGKEKTAVIVKTDSELKQEILRRFTENRVSVIMLSQTKDIKPLWIAYQKKFLRKSGLILFIMILASLPLLYTFRVETEKARKDDYVPKKYIERSMDNLYKQLIDAAGEEFNPGHLLDVYYTYADSRFNTIVKTDDTGDVTVCFIDNESYLFAVHLSQNREIIYSNKDSVKHFTADTDSKIRIAEYESEINDGLAMFKAIAEWDSMPYDNQWASAITNSEFSTIYIGKNGKPKETDSLCFETGRDYIIFTGTEKGISHSYKIQFSNTSEEDVLHTQSFFYAVSENTDFNMLTQEIMNYCTP